MAPIGAGGRVSLFSQTGTHRGRRRRLDVQMSGREHQRPVRPNGLDRQLDAVVSGAR
jgi:hypothetical protein